MIMTKKNLKTKKRCVHTIFVCAYVSCLVLRSIEPKIANGIKNIFCFQLKWKILCIICAKVMFLITISKLLRFEIMQSTSRVDGTYLNIVRNSLSKQSHVVFRSRVGMRVISFQNQILAKYSNSSNLDSNVCITLIIKAIYVLK